MPLNSYPVVRIALVVRRETGRQHATECLDPEHHFQWSSASAPGLTMLGRHRYARSAQLGRGSRCDSDAVDRCRRSLHAADEFGRNCMCSTRPCFHMPDIRVVCDGKQKKPERRLTTHLPSHLCTKTIPVSISFVRKDRTLFDSYRVFLFLQLSVRAQDGQNGYQYGWCTGIKSYLGFAPGNTYDAFDSLHA